MKDKKKKNTRNIAEVISETIIPIKTQSEYIDFHNKHIKTEISKEEKVKIIADLLKKKTALEDKKNTLFILAHGNDLRSLYGIQKYLKNPDPELQAWAVLAWQECQSNVLGEGLSSILGEAQDLIMGGLGGKDQKLRYCFVISTLEEKTFTKDNKNKVEETLKNIDKQYHSKSEKIEWGNAYAKITSIIPIDVASGDYVEGMINECNNPTLFLRFHYYIANNHDLTKDEIDEYLKELKNDEMKGNKVFQFKITLNDSKPKIWRRIQMPADYTFFDLHLAIQDAMGWFDSHLHGFRIAQKGTAIPINIQYPNPEADFGFGDKELDERKEYISDYFGKSIKQCLYEYDFGDGWDHTILFEKELSVAPNIEYPICIAGENACPPEDCGGVWGYKNLQDVLKNPKHPEHKDMLEWLDIEKASEFDTVHFDPKEVDFRNPKEVLKEYKKGFGM